MIALRGEVRRLRCSSSNQGATIQRTSFNNTYRLLRRLFRESLLCEWSPASIDTSVFNETMPLSKTFGLYLAKRSSEG